MAIQIVVALVGARGEVDAGVAADLALRGTSSLIQPLSLFLRCAAIAIAYQCALQVKV